MVSFSIRFTALFAGLPLTGTALSAAAIQPPTFTNSLITMPVNISGATTGDFNSDGLLDLAIWHTTGFTYVSVLINNSAAPGTFLSAKTFEITRPVIGLAAGDVNGDTRTDLVATTNSDGTFNRLAVLLANPPGSVDVLQPAVLTAFPAGWISSGIPIVVDMNNDGWRDVVCLLNPGRTQVLLNGGPSAPATFTDGGGGIGGNFSFTVGDFNGDTWMDYATTSLSNPDRLWVALNKQDGTFETVGDFPFDTNTLPGSLASGDLSGDGRVDLVLVNRYSGGGATVLLHQPAPSPHDGTLVKARNQGGLGSPQWVATGDFNGDGLPDFATASSVVPAASGLSPIQFYLGMESPHTGTSFVSANGPLAAGSLNLFAAVDLNNDGKPDLVCRDPTGGNGTKLHISLNTTPPTPPVCPADLNLDSQVDDADFVIFLAAYNELICM